VLTTAIRPLNKNFIARWPRQFRAGTGLLGWLVAKLHSRSRLEFRLLLVERIHLAPRQSLSLVEADGQRLLIATSADGAPVFYPLASPRRARTSIPKNMTLAESGK
jgi:hypothetical protein